MRDNGHDTLIAFLDIHLKKDDLAESLEKKLNTKILRDNNASETYNENDDNDTDMHSIIDIDSE